MQDTYEQEESSMRDGMGDDVFFFFQAEDGIRDVAVTGVQTCALPILWMTLRRRVGVESMLLRTTSMWPSLKMSPKAAPRAQTTEARPLPVAGGTSWNLAPSRLRKSCGRCAHVVPQSRLSAMG